MIGEKADVGASKEPTKVFYAIGDVAQEVGVEQYILRFWETKFSQINPIKRRGRRLYGRDDIEVIKKVKHMLYDLGYTIKGAQAELKKQRKCSGVTETAETHVNSKVLAELLENLTSMKNMLVEKLGGM